MNSVDRKRFKRILLLIFLLLLMFVLINQLIRNIRYNKVQGIDTKLLAGDDTIHAELNYYTLTLTKGTGISNVSGAAIYLKNQSASISATAMSGYGFQNWTITEGNTPLSTTNASTTVDITTKTSLTANGVDTEKPVVTISRTNAYTFNWTATDSEGVTGYQITNDSSIPDADASTWTTVTSATSVTNSYMIDRQEAKLYYVWAKDAAGNVSVANSIAAYSVTRDVGPGTSIERRDDATSSTTGTRMTTNPVVLSGTSIWISATADYGYHGLVLTKNGVAVSASGEAHTITAATTFQSIAAANEVTITINKDGLVWPDSGINVVLYRNGLLRYAYNTATVSGETVNYSGVVNGTYNVYASKSAAGLTTLVDTGKTVTISNNNTTETVDYYTLTKLQGANTTLTVRLDSISGTAISTTQVLDGTTVYAAATPATGYTGSMTKNGTVFTSGSTFILTETTTIESSAVDNTAPEVRLSRGNYDSFTWRATDAAGVTGYQITNSPIAPLANDSTWTTIISGTYISDAYNIDLTTAKTYYVWAKDAAGNVSATKSITSYVVTLINGEGTSIDAHYDSYYETYDTGEIVNKVVISGTDVHLDVNLLDGYSYATIYRNGEFESEYFFNGLINNTVTLESRATQNVVTVNIRQDDEAYSNSGMKISLYQDGEEKYTTICTNGNQAIFAGVITGTYDVYAGKDSLNKNTVVDTGLDVEVGVEPFTDDVN